MTVNELIDILRDMDGDARVLFMAQPSWPFEYSIRGVTTRSEIEDDHDDDDDEPTEDYGGRVSKNDVFLVEGSQLRYGSKNAWNLV